MLLNHFLSKSPRGSALIIAVSLIAIVMVTALSVFLRVGPSRQVTNNAKNQFDVKQLGELALSQIELDIEMEIFAGSDDEFSETYTSSDTEEGTNKKYYALYPKTREHMTPAKVLQAGLDEDTAGPLVKQSVNNQSFLNAEKFGSAGGQYAAKIKVSSINTGDPNSKGESMSASQWLAPQFIDLEKNNDYNQSTLPDWVYLDETGKNPTNYKPEQLSQAQDSDEKIIGRYAYQIYDTSGLIDLNVTGTNLSQELKSNKSSPHYIDLDLLGSNLGVQTSGLGSELKSWRQQASASKENYVSEWGEGNGWLKPYKNDTQLDQMFLSRQELIKFQRERPEVFNDRLLSYVTHFSRDLNQPDFRHDPDRPQIAVDKNSGGNDHYGEDEDAINPWLSRVRKADGSPLVETRFPLDRIDLLQDAGDAGLIEQYFGLTQGDNKWIYNKTNNGKILTLEEVASEGREPNMAELLKAAIHLGSLGQAGRTKDYEGNDYAYWKEMDTQVDAHILKIMANIIDQWDEDSYPTLIEYTNPNLEDIHPKLHTQILAGIEDIPYLLGVRDMPYRAEIYGDNVIKPGSDPAIRNPNVREAESVIYGYNFNIAQGNSAIGPIIRSIHVKQPIIWNPHQPSPNTISEKPTEFRVTARSNFNSVIDLGSSPPGQVEIKSKIIRSADPIPNLANQNDYSAIGLDVQANDTLAAQRRRSEGNFTTTNFGETPTWNPEETFITFNSVNSGPASFRDPYALEKPNYPSGSGAAYSGIPGVRAEPPSAIPANGAGAFNAVTPIFYKHHYRELNFEDTTEDPGEDEFIGFYMTENLTSASGSRTEFLIAASANARWALGDYYIVHGGFKFELQYLRDGNWITYDSLVDAEITDSMNVGYINVGDVTPGNARNAVDFTNQMPTRLVGGTTDNRDDVVAHIPNDDLTTPGGNGSLHTDYSTYGILIGTGRGSADSSRYGNGYLKSDPRTTRFGTHLLTVIRPWRNNSGRSLINGEYGTAHGNVANYSYLESGHSLIGEDSVGRAFNLYTSHNQQSWYHNYWNDTEEDFYIEAQGAGVLGVYPFNPIHLLTNTTDNENYYRDPDGVVRRASGAYQRDGIGMMTHEDTITGQVEAASDYKSRPIVLNRPFESLGELAHVFRDIPFRDIDLLNPESADRFLLNIFCLNSNAEYKSPQLRAGRININTASAEVLSTLFAQAAIDYNEDLSINEQTAQELGQRLYEYIHEEEATDGNGGENLILDLSEFVGRLDGDTTINGQHTQETLMQQLAEIFAEEQVDSKNSVNLNEVVTARKHVVARALTDNVTTRSWNFTIDLVVEEGQLSRNADSLSDFITQGSRRYWVHLSLDRLTGQILDRQIEQVPTSMRLTN